MKLRLSLRLYILGTLLFLITGLAAVYSVISVQYFIEGLDAITRRTMADVAVSAELNESGTAMLLGYHIVDAPDKLPGDIRQHIQDVPTQSHGFSKKIIQDTLFSRPTAAFFLMRVEMPSGDVRYVSRSFTKPPVKDAVSRSGFHPITGAMLVAVSVIIVFTVLLLMLLRSVAGPVERLRDWARSLTAERLRQPAPGFRYSELDTLAEIIRGSLQSVQQSLDREHDFLRHASHELRTPIATIQSNIELLRKLHPQPAEKEGRIMDRIARAGSTMGHLTNTLLWLSREDEEALPAEDIDLELLVRQVSQDLSYLLQGKQVHLHLSTQPETLLLPRVAVQIMLANLIRNAYQHTQAGEVWIEQEEATVTIVNRNAEEDTEKLSLGFGLGLDLTQKLARRFGWDYRHGATTLGYEAVVAFTPSGKV